jgi:hypothetical protein
MLTQNNSARICRGASIDLHETAFSRDEQLRRVQLGHLYKRDWWQVTGEQGVVQEGKLEDIGRALGCLYCWQQLTDLTPVARSAADDRHCKVIGVVKVRGSLVLGVLFVCHLPPLTMK